MVLRRLSDAFRVIVGRKIRQKVIDRLQLSGGPEIPYRGGTLEEFGTGFILRRDNSSTHPVYDSKGDYNGKVKNHF